MSVRPTKDRGSQVGLTRPGTAGSSAYLRGKLTIALKALTFVNGLALSGCETTGGYPYPNDVAAVMEEKPRPRPEILTDPAAHARYNSALKGWSDRLHAAGMRLCRFYERTGMPTIFVRTTYREPWLARHAID